MSQLKKSVNKDDNSNNNEGNNLSLKVTHTPNQTTEPQNTGQKHQQTETSVKATTQTTQGNLRITGSIETAEELVKWLFDILGKQVTTKLKNNQYLKIPFTEENLPEEQWLEKALKTIFPEADLNEIQTRISDFNLANKQTVEKIGNLEAQVAEFSETNEKYQKRFNQYKNEIEDLEEELHKNQSATRGQVALADVLKFAFPEKADTTAEKAFRTQLQRCVDNPTNENANFLTALLQAWPTVDFVHQNFGKDAEANMNKIYEALAYLMSRISGFASAERRPILDTLALWVSDWFDEFEFVSPERTLQADPNVHETSGITSTDIKEGRSFAIIRKDTKKTVRYAEITTY